MAISLFLLGCFVICCAMLDAGSPSENGPDVVIATERCRLRPPTDLDETDMIRLFQCAECRRFLGGPVEAEAFKLRFRAMLEADTTQQWVVRLTATGAFVGLVSLGTHHNGLDQEMSYQFLPEFWRHGLASESLRALLIDARERFGLESVIAETQTANARSIRLLERLDFQREQVLTRFGAEQAVYRKDLP